MQTKRAAVLSSAAWYVAFGQLSSMIVPEDVGFEGQFEDSLAEVYPEQCQSPVGLPQSLRGTFVVQSTAQYSMGGVSVNAWLDAYWKVHTVKVAHGEVCYKTRLIRTTYYNQSVEKNTVAGQVLFLETTPPRDCWLMGVCNMIGAGNDNNFAVTYRIRDEAGGFRHALMTDTGLHLDFDFETLDVIGARKFRDHFRMPLHMRSGGGTHLQCQAGKGDSAGNCEGDLYGVTYEQGATNFVDLYRLRAGAPDMRELVARIKVPFAPGSFHSFGLTSEYAILPLSPFTMDGPSMLEGKDIMHSIKNKGKETPIYLVHLVTGAVQQLTFPTSIFYIHAVNTWQNATHINFDASCFERQQFSLDNPAVALSVLRNKTARDIYHNTQTVRRYSIEFETGEVNELFLTEGPGAIDFPKVNPNNYGLPYCIYYGVEWKHNGRDFGSNALRKHNTCTGEVLFYYEPNNYLSEGIFVPDGGPNANEDDGVLISVRSSGLTNASTFLVLDAHTMTPVSEADLPHRVGWFGHTAWYPDTGAVVA